VNDPGRVNAGNGRWIYGAHAVERRLRVAPASVRTVYLGKRASSRRQQIAALAGRHGIAVREADEATLRKHAGSEAHQGVVALVTPFEYSDLRALAATGRPLLVVDQMNDPQNLGALIRTAVAAGFAGVVLPERGAAAVTAAVEKASAGAVNDLAVCRVVNLARALDDLAAAGYWRLALTPRDAASLYDVQIPTPVALVLGGETGIRRLVRERCDLTAAIPQIGPVESLNASVAGAVAMYEILRRGLNRP
jgi:23S rRNA (guanosine2251-2'-O)-methyltransferase